MFEDGFQQADQLTIALATWLLVLVLMPLEAAATDLQRLAQLTAGILCLELGHYFESLEGFESETMAKAFFKMSRWRRR